MSRFSLGISSISGLAVLLVTMLVMPVQQVGASNPISRLVSRIQYDWKHRRRYRGSKRYHRARRHRYSARNKSGHASSLASQDVKRVQAALIFYGFNAGEVDGVSGRQTGNAIREYQASINAQQTGQLTEEQKTFLLSNAARAGLETEKAKPVIHIEKQNRSQTTPSITANKDKLTEDYGAR